MTFLSRTVPVLTALLALAPLTQAASGGIDSFWSSANKVQVGDTVDFSVAVSLGTTYWAGGGSSPEPAPQEGYQEWNANWYSWEFETLKGVSLQAAGEGFSDSPSLAAGESYSNTWSFSRTFTEAGTFTFDLSGGWQSEVHYGYSNESASRNCYFLDPEGGGDLYCDSWYWQYSDADDWYSNEGNLSGGAISIEVVAVVPEPGTGALMLAGAGLLAYFTRRRSQGTGRPGVTAPA